MTTAVQPSVADRIRQAIASAHVAVEQTPFAQGMVAGRIDRATYCAGLAQVGELHRSLEAALRAAHGRCEAVAAVYDPERMERAGVIARDLAALGGEPAGPCGPVRLLAERADRWATETPWALVGALYVLEGSRMGSMVLARSLTRALGVAAQQGAGLDYHVEGIATRPADWKRFRAAVAGLPLSEAQHDDIVSAATATMDTLVEVYAAVPVSGFATAH